MLLRGLVIGVWAKALLQGSAHFPWHGDADSVVRVCREALAPVQPPPHLTLMALNTLGRRNQPSVTPPSDQNVTAPIWQR
jgi:hypothetical protein